VALIVSPGAANVYGEDGTAGALAAHGYLMLLLTAAGRLADRGDELMDLLRPPR
jgi:hypothetical protein